MLIIKMVPERNGAYDNQRSAAGFAELPDGWAAVPDEMEEDVAAMLPWIVPAFDGGTVTGVQPGEAPPPEPEPEPPPDAYEFTLGLMGVDGDD